MSTDAISSYLSSNGANASSSASSSTTNKNSLDMDDFIQLLVAQLKNQDMNNTTDTSQFMTQMAQFSMVQALTDMKEQAAAASSFSLIGKGATVSAGSQTVTGVVDGVTLNNNKAEVVINGNSYSVDDITEVFDASLLDK
jgi:Flagellar hook capping protein